MRVSRQAWWRVAKVMLTLAVVAAVGWQFARLLSAPELRHADFHARPGWGLVTAALYLVGIGCSACYWYALLRTLGQHTTALGVVRAYYVGQLGRYVPGKVVAVAIRAQLLSGPGVATRVAVLTIVYESLTTLTSGALLAAVLLPWLGGDQPGKGWQALGLLLLVGIPLFPALFNRLIRRLTASLSANGPPLSLRPATLLQGLALTGTGWALQGASVWAIVRAVAPQPVPWHATTWAAYTAFIALATVTGFLVITVPGGLGVRELILQQFLAKSLTGDLGADSALATSVVAVLVLRLVVTVAEVAAAGAVYWIPTRTASRRLPGGELAC